MAVKDYIISYGYPRSGTTLIRQMLWFADGPYGMFRLREGDLRHPANGAKGLLDIIKLFRHQRVIVIRTTRHPVDAIESMCVPHPERTNTPFILQHFIEWYRSESVNTKLAVEMIGQWAAIYREYAPLCFALLTLRYVDIGDDEARRSIFAQIVAIDEELAPAVDQWDAYIKERWNKTPSRAGKMKNALAGNYKNLLSGEWMKRIRDELSDVIAEEGLQGTSQYIQD